VLRIGALYGMVVEWRKVMNVYDHLEPNLIDAKTSGMDADVMISIAISLKRIADVLDKELATMIIAGRDTFPDPEKN